MIGFPVARCRAALSLERADELGVQRAAVSLGPLLAAPRRPPRGRSGCGELACRSWYHSATTLRCSRSPRMSATICSARHQTISRTIAARGPESSTSRIASSATGSPRCRARLEREQHHRPEPVVPEVGRERAQLPPRLALVPEVERERDERQAGEADAGRVEVELERAGEGGCAEGGQHLSSEAGEVSRVCDDFVPNSRTIATRSTDRPSPVEPSGTSGNDRRLTERDPCEVVSSRTSVVNARAEPSRSPHRREGDHVGVQQPRPLERTARDLLPVPERPASVHRAEAHLG